MVENTNSGEEYLATHEVTLKQLQDCVVVEVRGYKIVINHADVGVSIDVYDNSVIEEELISENQYWWCDLNFEEEL